MKPFSLKGLSALTALLLIPLFASAALAQTPPIAVPDSIGTPVDAPVAINILANDSDPDGNGLDVASVVPEFSVSALHGTVSAPDPVTGAVTYTPGLGWTGRDEFDYEVADLDGDLPNAVATVIVWTSDVPWTNDDAFSTDEDVEGVFAVLDNDIPTEHGINESRVEIVTDGTNGHAVPDPVTGEIRYWTTLPHWNGGDTFTYRVQDGAGQWSLPATVAVTVNAVDDPPFATDDVEMTPEGVAVTIDILGNDLDPEGDFDVTSVLAGAVNVPPTSTCEGALLLGPAHGTITACNVGGIGAVTYTPFPNFNGTDVFTYTVDDLTASGPSNAATVTITVTSDGVLPIAAFTVDDQTPDPDQTVTFNNLSTEATPAYTMFAWDFGDPCSGSSNTTSGIGLENPSHTYRSPGAYTVTLTITNSAGEVDDEEKIAYITVPLWAGSDNNFNLPAFGEANVVLPFNVDIITATADPEQPLTSTNRVIMAIRVINLDPDIDQLQSITLNSRCDHAFSLSRLAIYQESACPPLDPVNEDNFGPGSDDLLGAVNPGRFQYDASIANNPGDAVTILLDTPVALAPVDDPDGENIAYLYVVVDINPDAHLDFNYNGAKVGVALNAITGPGEWDVIALHMGNAGDGPTNGVFENVPSQPLTIDPWPPAVVCPDDPLAPPEGEFTNPAGGGLGLWKNDAADELTPPPMGGRGTATIDINDHVIFSFYIPDVDGDLKTASPWPRADMRAFGGIERTWLHDDGADGDAVNGDGWFSCELVSVGENIGHAIDVLPEQYSVPIEIKDDHGNKETFYCPVTVGVDTKAPDIPTVASGNLSISLINVVGDECAAIGDIIRFYIDFSALETNLNRNGQSEEIQQVQVDLSPFGMPLVDWVDLADISGDNYQWELQFELTEGTAEALADDIEVDFRVWDNSNNLGTRSNVEVPFCVDVEPPMVAGGLFTWTVGDDVDENNVLNLGDENHFELDATDIADITSITIDLWTPGLGGNTIEPMVNGGPAIYTVDWPIPALADWPHNAPTIDVLPAECPGLDGYGSMLGRVKATLVDDVGNVFEAWVGPPLPVDTRPPDEIAGLYAKAVGGVDDDCSIELHWDADYAELYSGVQATIIKDAGAHDGGDNVLILSDLTMSWIPDELVGMTLVNTTDGSSGIITENTATTVTAVLAGGPDDDWDIADAYQIISSDNSVTLIDLGAGWTPGALVGMHVYNTTDGSSGAIMSNTSTTITVVLEYGVDNDWDAGDAYSITPGAADHPYTYLIYMEDELGTFNEIAEVKELTPPDVACTYIIDWSTDGTVPVVHGETYKFKVHIRDNGDNLITSNEIVAATADCEAPDICVLQPVADTTKVYGCDECPFGNENDIGLTIYVHDLNETDLESIGTVWVRLKYHDNGHPGPWTAIGTTPVTSADPLIFGYLLSCDDLNALVGPDDLDYLELVVTGVDQAGNTISVDVNAEIATGCEYPGGLTYFTFQWSTNAIAGTIDKVNGLYAGHQDYCDETGFAVEPTNTVEIRIDNGNPPYTIQASVDGNVIYFEDNVEDSVSTFDFDAVGWDKGAHTLKVEWCDNNGAYTIHEVQLCMPDEIGPCAEIINPVDGKCVRKARSVQDPVPITICIDPDVNCVDPLGTVKIDIEWADSCCFDSFWAYVKVPDTTSLAGGDTISCDTTYFEDGPFEGDIETIGCLLAGQDSLIITWVVDSNWVSCADDVDWRLIGIIASVDLDQNECYTLQWYNHDDLEGYGDGDIIYLRGRVYDDQGNVFTTDCIEVCVDTTTPPLCLRAPDECIGEGGVTKLGGGLRTFVADLDWENANVDDIEYLYLFSKKSTDADFYSNWTPHGAGVLATNSTAWTWDVDINASFTDQVYYDFRVIAKTIWGTYSYDWDGDTQFDDYTFNVEACDMGQWFIDRTAEDVWMDTLWTMIDDHELIQPNVSCRLSDPRGWGWTQYGNEITIAPQVGTFENQDDIVKLVWTLWENGEDCASCACVTDPDHGFASGSEVTFGEGVDCHSKTVAIREADNALDAIEFNPAEMAFWLDVANGYQTVILQLEAFDACGNSTTDCITLYLLDIDPTEAIIIDPKNHEVVCQDHDIDGGGIQIDALTLMGESMEKAIFRWATHADVHVEDDWNDFDSTSGSGLTGYWYPHALGLDDGSYDLTVITEDDAGNRSEVVRWITVHLSCGLPEVRIIYPYDHMFVGCPMDVKAVAYAPDDFNYIEWVDFYVVPVTSSPMGGDRMKIGRDQYSADSVYGAWWVPDLDGDYYVYAVVRVKSGVEVVSELVWISTDKTGPEVNMLDVGDDVSNGPIDAPILNPTVIFGGHDINIHVEAWDRRQEGEGGPGYGDEDNCGLDSVKIYIAEAKFTWELDSGDTIGVLIEADEVLFGELMQPQPVPENVHRFEQTWTAPTINGYYVAYAIATDSCCNNTVSDYWLIEVVNKPPAVMVAVIGTKYFCDSTRTNDSSLTLRAIATNDADIDSVQFWYNSASQSDVYDQYDYLGVVEHDQSVGGYYILDTLMNGNEIFLSEGAYRLRAVAWKGETASDDGNDSDTDFDDFTFNEVNDNHMILVIDRSAPKPVFTLAADVIAEGTMFEITVADPPCDSCDIHHYEYGIVTAGGKYGTRPEYTSTECNFLFDPADSGLVTMSHCYWGGYVRVTAIDPLGNETYYQLPAEILGVEDGDALVTTPAHGTYVAGTVAIVATAVGTVAEYTFKYTLADGTGGDVIGTSTDGTILWDTETDEVADGTYMLWVKGNGDYHAAACAVPVVLVNDCAVVELLTPIPSDSTCHPGNVRYIGGTVDLRAEVTLTSNVPVDSVVFKYKTLDAPGGHTDTGDPANGWVTLGSDRYKATSWDISWNTADIGKVVPDGYYVIMAFSYDRSGQECHSNSITLFVDNTKPFSEISEVNGDQTTSTCADVTEGTNVEIVAVAVDDRSPLGPGTEYNSCPKYLQFFAGHCDTSGGPVDIVWVVDVSGSMDDEQTVIGGQISKFVGSLGGLDYRLAVTAFESEGFFRDVVYYNDTTKSVPMNTDGSHGAELVGTGAWTVSDSAFNLMVTSVAPPGLIGGVEDGVGSLMEVLEHYTFRTGVKKYFILVTDESGDDNELETEALALLKENNVTVHVVTNPSFETYSNIADETGGQVYNIASADWGALLAVLGTQISGTVAGPTPMDPIWGKVVDLDTDAPSVHWNTTGLAPGEYCLWTVITDKVGNQDASQIVKVCVYDVTPPVAWIAGFGDATVACPACDAHRIYAMTCDTDVKALKFEIRQADLTGELDWTTIGITTMIDSSLWYTDWDPCMLAADDYSLRAVPVSAHYETGTKQHIDWDIDAAGNPILAITVDEDCSITYSSGDLNTLIFEDKSSGDLGIANLTSSSAINALRIGMLGIYQPLNEKTLTTERVNLVQMMGMENAVYLGNINDQLICLGGVGSFYGSYYVAAEDEDPVSYLIMSDITVARVYPTLGLPGTLCNTATGVCVNIERDAVSTTQGVIILPALEPTMFTPQNDLYNVWPANIVTGYLPAIRFTGCGGEPITGLNSGKYAKIKIPYGSGAPIVDSLAVAWWDGDEWRVNVGIFFGSGAEGFNATARTVEFWSNDLYGIYAVVSNDADTCRGPITVTAAPHDAVTPWANSYTDATPTFNTLVRSNITGNDNNWDVDSLQTHVKLDGITIYNNGANATGWITTWDNVSGLLQTRWRGAAALDEGAAHTYWVKARTFQGCAKTLTVNFEVDETAPTIEWPDDYVCPNPEFRIILSDNGAGIDLDSIQADVYDYDLSLGTEIPSDKLVYEEHASGFEVINGTEEITLVFSLTAENAIYRRYVVVLWDGTSCGRYKSQDDDDRDYTDRDRWIYHNDHGVPDLVGNHATPVFRMFTVGGEDCDVVGGDEPYNDPNPFDPWAGEATTIFVGSGDGVSVKIYDLAGEKVIALWENENTFISGTSVKWDGQVDGKIVASGVYLCHISGRNSAGMSFSHVVKIAVVKR